MKAKKVIAERAARGQEMNRQLATEVDRISHQIHLLCVQLGDIRERVRGFHTQNTAVQNELNGIVIASTATAKPLATPAKSQAANKAKKKGKAK